MLNTHLSPVLTAWKVMWLPLNACVDILVHRPSPLACRYLPTVLDDNDQYRHFPAMPGPSAMHFHSFILEISQLYITCALLKVMLFSEQLILGPNMCSTLFLSIIYSWRWPSWSTTHVSNVRFMNMASFCQVTKTLWSTHAQERGTQRSLMGEIRMNCLRNCA